MTNVVVIDICVSYLLRGLGFLGIFSQWEGLSLVKPLSAERSLMAVT